MTRVCACGARYVHPRDAPDRLSNAACGLGEAYQHRGAAESDVDEIDYRERGWEGGGWGLGIRCPVNGGLR